MIHLLIKVEDLKEVQFQMKLLPKKNILLKMKMILCLLLKKLIYLKEVKLFLFIK